MLLRGPFDLADVPAADVRYRRLSEEGLGAARVLIERTLEAGPRRFFELWPEMLEDAHLRRADLGEVVLPLRSEGRISIDGMTGRQRAIRDQHVLRLVPE